MSVLQKLTSIEWWNGNVLLYGCDRNHLYNIVCELIKHKNNGKHPHISVEHVNSANSLIRISPLHHEFDFAISYNSATTTELIDRVTQLSGFRRIEGKKHIIFLHNIDILTNLQINRFKSTVQNYSDRTCFIITTTKLAKMPLSIQYSCAVIRCPLSVSNTSLQDICDAFKKNCNIANCLHKKLQPVFKYMMLNCKSLNNDKQSLLLVALKDFAYTCIGYNVRFAYVSKAIVDIVSDLKASNDVLQSIVETLANCEASSHGMKKDIIAWELAFIQIVRIFKERA